MVRGTRLKVWLGAGALGLAALTGCDSGRKSLPPEPPPRPTASEDPVLAGSLGSVTYLASVAGQPVRGFGLVMGLGENGSSDCPTVVREHLIEVMSKEAETWPSLKDRQEFKAGDLIDSLSTAVVEVIGLVPTALRAGGRFDIQVQAIPGTATSSLAGGLLLPCELRLGDLATSYEELLGAAVVARAGGPVFVNPFTTEASGVDGADPRRGIVLSGGQAIGERTTRLLLREPSYPAARRLERRVNERFGAKPPTAEAMSQGYLVLHTPKEYEQRPTDFIQLVTHLYIDGRPEFIEPKLRELARLITLPDAAYERIALAWESTGRTALPTVQPLYTHPDPQVRLYAARAGLRLRDVNALPVLGELAASTNHSVALLAVHELGRCPYPQAAVRLEPLLSQPDPEIRIATYEALLSLRHPAIQSTRFASVHDPMQTNLFLDVVESSGQPLIYARRTRVPRIAVFSPRMAMTLPLFYAEPDDSVTLNAAEDGAEITLFTKRAGRLSPTVVVPARVADLIAALADRPVKDQTGRMRGVGLPYSHVVRVLSVLSRDGTIPAPLELERLSLTEILGPQAAPERPETDQEVAPPRDAARPDREPDPAP